MKYASLLLAALFTSAIVAKASAASDQTQPEARDLQALTTISTEFVIETTFLPQIMRVKYDDDKGAILADIGRLEPEVRNLFWLSYLHYVVPGGELHHFFTTIAEARKIQEEAKKLLVAQGQSVSDDTLHEMTEMSKKSDPARNADAVLQALTAAGLTRQAQAFAAVRDLAAKSEDADFAALDVAFGEMTELPGAIGSYVERTPGLVEWSAKAREKIGDEDRLSYLTGKLNAMEDAEIDRLPKALKQIYVVDYFNAEMLNGGVHQFFFNSSGGYAPDVAVALRELGLTTHADVIERGIDMFSKPYPTDMQKRRVLNFAGEWGAWDEALSALTYEVDDGEISPALITLAKHENLLPR